MTNKRLGLRKNRNRDCYRSNVLFELTWGGERVGTVSRQNEGGFCWCVNGDRLGIRTHNSLWGGVGAKSYPTVEQAKDACIAYARTEMEKKKQPPGIGGACGQSESSTTSPS